MPREGPALDSLALSPQFKKLTRVLRRRVVQVLPDRLPLPLERLVVNHPRITALYLAATGRLSHEAQTVLAGLLAHEEPAPTGSDGPRYTLRRNTHRLEKGLIMRPRRAVFALDYIGETLDALAVVLRTQRDTDAELLQWAGDVLRQYFEACSGQAAVAPALQRYHDLLNSGSWVAGNSAPYLRPPSVNLPTYEQLRELAQRRRSVRWFQARRVPHDVIDQAIEVGIQAPSACNRQPFRFLVLDDPELVAQVAKIPMGTAGYAENIPMLLVAVGQLRAFHSERDRHLIYIDTALALMGLQLALETLGLSSCSINWPAIPEKESAIRKAIPLAADEQPIMLLAVGYADETGYVPFSQKKSLSEVRSFNK